MPPICYYHFSKASNRALRNGPVAQLGERLVRNEKVAGSIPVRSTIFEHYFLGFDTDLLGISIAVFTAS